jgi:outer membrane protein assembly factor BamB
MILPPEVRFRSPRLWSKDISAGEAIWTFQHIEDVYCVAAVKDIDNEVFRMWWLKDSMRERLEIIWYAFPVPAMGLFQSSMVGQSSRGPSNSGGYGDECLSPATDINGDGVNDVLLGTAWGSRSVFAINGANGETIWSFDTYQNPPSGWVYSVKQTSDNNGDGIPEVIAAAGSDADAVYQLDGATGQFIWSYTADDAVMSVTSLTDINADSMDEVAFGGADYSTHAYCVSGASQGAGTLLWTFTIGTSTHSVTTIQDINNDGYRDVLCGN